MAPSTASSLSMPSGARNTALLLVAGALGGSVIAALARRAGLGRRRHRPAAAGGRADESRSTTSSAGGGVAAYETRRAVDEYLQFHFGAEKDILPYDVGPKVNSSGGKLGAGAASCAPPPPPPRRRPAHRHCRRSGAAPRRKPSTSPPAWPRWPSVTVSRCATLGASARRPRHWTLAVQWAGPRLSWRAPSREKGACWLLLLLVVVVCCCCCCRRRYCWQPCWLLLALPVPPPPTAARLPPPPKRHVLGIDYSHTFVEAAQTMKERGWMRYRCAVFSGG